MGMLKVMAHTNIVFGNETEADAFGKAMGYDTDNRIAIAKKIANLPCEAPFPRSRVVVITQGKDPIIVIENGQATQHPVIDFTEKKNSNNKDEIDFTKKKKSKMNY